MSDRDLQDFVMGGLVAIPAAVAVWTTFLWWNDLLLEWIRIFHF